MRAAHLPERSPSGGLYAPSEVSRAEWRALVTASAHSEPKLLPEVALDARRGAQAEPVLFWRINDRGARALAVLERRPVRLARAPGLGRLTSMSALRVVGSDLFGDVDRGSAEAFIGAASAAIDGRNTGCVWFDDLDTGSPLAEPIEAARRKRLIDVFSPFAPQPHWYIRFPDPPAAYWKTLPGKARYKLRRKARAFSHRVVAITEPGEVEAFLQKARAISERSWQGKRFGLRVRASAAEIREAKILAAAGAFRSYLLERDDGTPVAFVLGTQWQGRFRHEETGYDMAFAELSPGIVLLYGLLGDLLAREPPELLDFGAGDAEYKRSFANVYRESGRVALIRRGGYPLAASALARGWLGAERRGRDVLRRTGIYEKARRLYRGRR